MAFDKSSCKNCVFWDKEKAITYDSGRMAPCSKLSGKHSPMSGDTKMYAVYQRGSSGPGQNVVTRCEFYCNQYRKLG